MVIQPIVSLYNRALEQPDATPTITALSQFPPTPPVPSVSGTASTLSWSHVNIFSMAAVSALGLKLLSRRRAALFAQLPFPIASLRTPTSTRPTTITSCRPRSPQGKLCARCSFVKNLTSTSLPCASGSPGPTLPCQISSQQRSLLERRHHSLLSPVTLRSTPYYARLFLIYAHSPSTSRICRSKCCLISILTLRPRCFSPPS